MRVALVATTRVECGIASYTDYLGTALKQRGHDVMLFGAELDDRAAYYGRGTSLPYTRCWTRQGWYGGLEKALASFAPSVLHVQHEYGLHLGVSEFSVWIKSQSRPLVVTFHTVPIPGHQQAKDLEWLPRCLSGLRAHAIAHAPHAVEALQAYGVTRTHCIPHGSCGPYMEAGEVERRIARMRLSLPAGGVIGATLGFWTPGKRNDQTVAALLRLLARNRLPPDFVFVFAGQPMGKDAEKGMRETAAQLERAGLADTIRIRPGFIDDALMADYYSAVDFTVANCGPTMYSTTGRGHLAMAYGSPVLAADVPLLEEFRECGLTFSTLAGLDEGIARLANDAGLRAELVVKARAFAEQTSWERVAEMHEQVYEEAVA